MSFDPYRKWLGIPSNRRPPNYYELLGITAGEKDADVIRSAIDQRRMYIRSKKGEGQDGHVKAILGLIEEASSTLLVPEFKHGYDRQLGLHLKQKGSRRSYVLPSWIESRVVRVYGEGSGIVGDVLGIVSILLVAFGLMAWWSFRLHDERETVLSDPAPIIEQKAADEMENKAPAIEPVEVPVVVDLKPIEKTNSVEELEREISAVPKVDVPVTASPPVQVQTGWKALVKGNDLTGWTGFTKGFFIDEGVLVMQNNNPSERGDIYTEADFEDFVLRYDFQLPNDANSGITPRYRSDDSRNIKINLVGKDFKLVAKNGNQIETDPKNNQVGVIIPSGYKAPYVFPDSPVILPPPAWNKMEVSAIGAKLTVTVNDVCILDQSFDEFAVEAADKAAWKRRTKGRIGISNFTGTVRFRDIKIQEVQSQAVVQQSVNRKEPSISSSTAKANQSSTVSFTAFTISIDEKGNGKFTVDTRPVEEAHKVNEPLGKLVKIKSLEPALVYKLDDGRLHLRYDFSKMKTLDGLRLPKMNELEEKLFSGLRIDSDEGLLVLSQNQHPTSSSFVFPRPMSVPINIRVLFRGLSEGLTSLNLYLRSNDRLLLSLHGENSAFKGRGLGTVDLRLSQNDNWKELVQKIQPPNSRDETSFKIPSELIPQRMSIRLVRLGSVPLGVPVIEVVSKFSPAFGISLAQNGSKVLVKTIISEGGAEQAGLKQGDVLISINGQVAKDIDTSVSLFAMSPFDQVAELEIERFGKKRTFRVTPQ